MKYAIISDIHGNLPALRAVLQDAQAQGADTLLFAGDYYTNSPWPNEVIELVQALGAGRTIAGNEEGHLPRLAAEDPAGWMDGQFSALYWSYNTITPENRAFLSSLPDTLDIADPCGDLHIAHASTAFIGDVEKETLYCDRIALAFADKTMTREALLIHARAALADSEALPAHLDALADGVYIFGHTHVQWHARLGGKLLINAGSCGLCLDGIPGAAYTLLEVDAAGWRVQERRVPYDLPGVLRDLKASPLYAQARVWSEVVMAELETGYGHVLLFLRFAETYAQGIGDPVRPFTHATWAAAHAAWRDSLQAGVSG